MNSYLTDFLFLVIYWTLTAEISISMKTNIYFQRFTNNASLSEDTGGSALSVLTPFFIFKIHQKIHSI